MNTRWATLLAMALLIVMALLMIRPALEDSAIVEETNHLTTGYTYWKGYKFLMLPEHPPLSQMLPGIPLLAMDLKFSPIAEAFLGGRLGSWWYEAWSRRTRSVREIAPPGCTGKFVALPPIGDVAVEWSCSSSYPLENWYYVAGFEAQMLGKVFVYGGINDGDRMLLAGRSIQMALTLLTGVLIFFWVRSGTANPLAPIVALALWVFNPSVLATGHIIDTDQGLALGMTFALFMFGRFLMSPNSKRAAICGAATGLALVMKFTAITLAPMIMLLTVLSWKRLQLPAKTISKMAGWFLGFAWVVILIVYFPKWSPAPSLSDAQYTAFDVPWWFRILRPILIPPDFFKGLALVLGHSGLGHTAYLFGQLSNTGWWYYYPSVLFLKSPLAFVILTVWGSGSFLSRFKSALVLELIPWLSCGVYLFLAMTSKSCIGVKQLLPMFPLLCVGIGFAVARVESAILKRVVLILVMWQVVVTLLTYPQFVTFLSEAVGGAKNGDKYVGLTDFDWGQDAKRLQKFLDERGIKHIYLDYYGTQYSIEYLHIPNSRVTAESAHKIQQGYLVVSHSQLIQPEWQWLRESRQPIARVAHTLFVYQFP